MCLIIDKPEGTRIPADWLSNAVANNDDGWGIMWANQGSVHVEKGFKLKGLRKWEERLSNKHAVFHMRLATSGKKDINNCHPFQTGPDVWMMHNGIISIPRVREEWSDTKTFAEYCVRPVLTAYPSLYGSKLFEGMMSYFVGGGNKLAFMNGKGEVVLVNKGGGVEKEGLWLSNFTSVCAPIIRSNVTYIFDSERNDDWWGGYRRPLREVKRLPASSLIVTHTCSLCKAEVSGDEEYWEYIVGIGYVCPMCIPHYESDVERMQDINLYDLSQLPMEDLKTLVKACPDEVAWMIAMEWGYKEEE